MIRLTFDHARTALLHAQGLTGRQRKVKKADLLDTIRRLGVLQIDSISVVNRSPYLVLWSRLGHFPLNWLTDLLAERKLFEYWSHAACFLPIEDFGQYRRSMLERRAPDSRVNAWVSRRDLGGTIEAVREHIRANGEVRSADFERSHDARGGWWNWKSEKLALECLFDFGELMVARRENFQRVYDLQERIHPWDDANTPDIGTIHADWVERTVRKLGVAPERWLADYFRIKKGDVKRVLPGLVKDGMLIKVHVGDDAQPWYVHRDDLDTLQQVADGAINANRTTVLSPFDPVVWDRERLAGLFGMDYKIEVYTPEHKRKFGYFTLPILHGTRMVGRLDPKAHRKDGVLEIRRLHLEPGEKVTNKLVTGLNNALHDFAQWHGTPEVRITDTDSPAFADALRSSGLD